MQFLQRMRTWEYRQMASVHRCSKPSRVERARRLGYKAKQGFVVYRVKIRRGNRKRPAPKGVVCGKLKSIGVAGLKNVKNYQSVAEEKVGRKLPGLRVLNSYWVGQDATFKFFEVILVDPNHQAVRNDPGINWIVSQKHREMRGLTSAGRKHRGLRTKGNKDNKRRPSYKANYKRRNQIKLRRYR